MSKFGLYIGDSFKLDESDTFFVKISNTNLIDFYTFDSSIFDVLILENCLQRVDNFDLFFKNASNVLKKGGQIILILPDYKLFEKCTWPSKFSQYHINSFSLNLNRNVVRRLNHWHISENLLPILKTYNFDDFECFLDDNNFDYDKPVLVDQTKDGASCFIFIKSVLKNEEIVNE